jgi:vacuolar protein-sorting-associated protein 4
MFEINIDKISPKPDVSEEQLTLLANKTEGFSGSDIAVLCRDAVMEPVRRCQDAQEFQEVEVEDDEGNKLKKLMPCAPGTKGGIKMTLMQLAETRGPEMLIAPPVNYRDFDKTLLRCKPSVSEGDLQEFQDFTNNYGQEG